MRISTLYALLNLQLSASVFKAAVADDVAEYAKNAGIVGSVMPVSVEEDYNFQLSAAHIKTLCELFIENELSDRELAFIADALQMSDGVDFEDGIADLVAEMTDPEINGPFTVDRARKILRNI